jgi:hypothetical protein
MKLIISESQYNMLKVINESIKDVQPYIDDIKKIGEEVNGLYNLVLTINVGEVIDGTSDFLKYNEKAELLQKKLDNRNKLGEAEIQKMSEEEYDNFSANMPVNIDQLLYDEYRIVSKKLDAIEAIIYALKDIEKTTE